MLVVGCCLLGIGYYLCLLSLLQFVLFCCCGFCCSYVVVIVSFVAVFLTVAVAVVVAADVAVFV